MLVERRLAGEGLGGRCADALLHTDNEHKRSLACIMVLEGHVSASERGGVAMTMTRLSVPKDEIGAELWRAALRCLDQ